MTLKSVVKPRYREKKEEKETKTPTLPTAMPRGIPRYARPTRYPSDHGDVIVMPEETVTAEPQREGKTLADGTIIMPELVIRAEDEKGANEAIPENLSLKGGLPPDGADIVVMPEMVITAEPPAKSTAADDTIIMPEMVITAGEGGETESAPPDEDVIVMPEMVITAGEEESTPSPSPLSTLPTTNPDAGPDTLVRQWQGNVQQAGNAVKTPDLPAATEAPAKAKSGGAAVAVKQAKSRATINKEAKDAIPPTPKVEPPPPPPANNPIPAHTKAIEEASDKRLPPQQLPLLVPGPKGTQPQLGMKPIPPQMFQLLTTPGALDLAGIPDDKENDERKALEYALKEMTKDLPAPDKDSKGQPVPLVDKGPQPVKPLPPALKTPVGQVIARLLAQPENAAKDILTTIRKDAYPKEALEKEYPEMGQEHLPTIQKDMVTELRLVAEAAGLTGKELDGMIADRHRELEAEKQKAQGALETANKEVDKAVKAEGQGTLDEIAAAKKRNDEEILRRQESASGGTDPAVIEARKKLTVEWIRERVTVQTTNYHEAGEKRQGELSSGQKQQEDAYTYVAQREEYALLNPKPPAPARDPADQKKERALQDEAATIRAWASERKEAVKTAVRGLKKEATTTTKSYRDAIEGAGTVAVLAAETWASDRINEGKSWWDRFIGRLRGWSNAAREGTTTWEVRRTKQTRDGIVQDLMSVGELQAKIAEGATKEQLLADKNLTAEEKAIIEAHFASGGKAHPLDLAAAALRVRVAGNHRSRVAPRFEAELIAKPAGEWKKIDKVVRALTPGFDADKIATEVHAAMDQWGTDEAKIYRNLHNLTVLQGSLVRKIFSAKGWGNLDAELESELSGDELERAQLQLEGKHGTADAVALHDAVTGAGTDEDAIWELLRGRSQEEIDVIKSEYKKKYGVDLSDRLKEDLSEGNEQDRADALLKGDFATADAIALDEAMRGGFLGTGWGTKEEDIEKTYNTVRDEVKAQAQREGWNTAQMEAEIRRRNAAIEAKFGTRYANVEEYKVPGMEGKSVLRQAFASEMDPGPERDLANALADNDMLAADMAKIEIERQSVFYADDDKINGVLRSQYERALEETRRDEGNARHMAVERKIQAALKANPNMSAEELSKKRFEFEHENERSLEEVAQKKSKISMDALTNSYDKKYGKPLWYVIETNTSGNDLDRARALLKQGGKLTPYQEIRYATKGVGTDEDAVKNAVKGRTKAEIDEIRKEWNAKHPDHDFDSMLRGELSGRDEFDVMEMVENGAPESASQKIASLKRRTNYELDESGVLSGGAVAGNEQAWLKARMQDLENELPNLQKPCTTEEDRKKRQELLDEVEFQAGRIETAIEDHRRRVDSVTDMVAQAVGLVVAITVGAALTFLSGGTLGPVMIMLIASIAATTSTMATRRLMMGDAYGGEAMGIDAAIGVVDAITAVATAGMGGKLLRGATMAGKVIKPNVVTKFAGNLAKGRLGQIVSKVPGSKAIKSGVSKLNQMESGFLTRGIKGQNFLSRMAKSDKAMVRQTAEMLAEGVENAVSAAPSAFMGTALNDETWKGNVALNLVFGTATGVGQGVGMGLGMGLGMKGAGKLWGGAKSTWRMATPEGRVREGARVMSDAFQNFREKNPGATYTDFHATPEGQKLMGELKQKGMHPETAFAHPGETHATGAEKVPDPATQGDAPPAKNDASAPEPTAKGEADPALKPTSREAPLPPKEGGIVIEKGDASPLTAALPERMRKNVTVEVDPKLEGNTVKVVPEKVGGRITGVKIVAGPDARPIDVAMHAPTVHAMQKYTGLLGRLRTMLEKMDAWFHLQDHITVGSKAWEARLEVQKLPFIIEERISRLQHTDLTPDERRLIIDDIINLEGQLSRHQKTFDARDTGEGRGFVAAEGQPKTTTVPEVPGAALGDVSVPGSRAHFEGTQAKFDQARSERGAAHASLSDAQQQLQKAEKVRDAELAPKQSEKKQIENRIIDLNDQLSRAQAAKDPQAPKRESEARAGIAYRQKELARVEAELKAINERHQGTIDDRTLDMMIATERLATADTALQSDRLAYQQAIQPRIDQIAGQELPRLQDRAKVARAQFKALEMEQAIFLGKNIEIHKLSVPHVSAAEKAQIRAKYGKQIAEYKSLVERTNTARKLDWEANHAVMTAENQILTMQKQLDDLAREGNWTKHTFDDFGKVDPCFPPGTWVHTPAGLRPIEQLQPEEPVFTYDIEHNCAVVRPILKVHKNWSGHLVSLKVNHETILATRRHPFWDPRGLQWVEACELKAGMVVQDSTGASVVLADVQVDRAPTATYNLEIADYHTYFVGETGILVHNGSGTEPRFLETERKKTRIYIIYDLRPGRSPQDPRFAHCVIYVGKTFQGEDPMKRFYQHLQQGQAQAQAGHTTSKAQWQSLHARGQIIVVEIAGGDWTEFETAVHEQHFITMAGGPNTQGNPHHTFLENLRNEITRETYEEYRNAVMLDENGRPFQHIGCP